MSGIHCIGGEKGGVGKSVVARLLAQYHIDRQRPFLGFDTDRSHGTFRRFYGDFAAPVAIDAAGGLDPVVEAVVAAPERTVLVDFAAQTRGALQAWMDETDLPQLLADMAVPLRFWQVLDDGADALALLEAHFDSSPASAAQVIVLNHGRGRDFSRFHAAPVAQRAAALGVPVIELPRLAESAMQRIDHANASFWSATHGGGAGLGLLDRQRVKVWLARSYAAFDRVFTAA